MAVGLVFVSHSAAIAGGLVELAASTAPTVRLVGAGGSADGAIGTSVELVCASIAAADSGDGVVVLGDLGPALLTSRAALDSLGDAMQARVRVVDAPLVEGGVAASLAAERGETLEGVMRAAESAGGGVQDRQVSWVTARHCDQQVGYTRTVTLTNAEGLHARPAAEFAKLAATFDAAVTINGKDARSVLGVMSLGLVRGTTVEIASIDSTGRAAVDALSLLIETGFGEH